MRPFGSPKLLEQRRRRALEMLEEGRAPVEVARELGVDRRSVRRWKAAARRLGKEAIRARPAPGRPPRLNPTQKKALEKYFLAGAQASGFDTDLWTLPRVAQLIVRRFGVYYHVAHVSKLLHRLGWSPQKPQRRAVERDDKAVQTWLKKDWPRTDRNLLFARTSVSRPKW
jgi:transposase